MVKRTDPYVPGEQVEQKDIVKLNTNENPYPPSPKVIAAIQQEMGATFSCIHLLRRLSYEKR